MYMVHTRDIDHIHKSLICLIHHPSTTIRYIPQNIIIYQHHIMHPALYPTNLTTLSSMHLGTPSCSPFLDGERIFQRTRGWLSHNISLLFFRIVNFNHTSHTLTAQFARMPHIMSRCVDISDLLQCIHRGYAQCIYRDVLPCDMNRSLWTAHHSSVNVSIPRRFCNTLCSLDEKTLI